jgi:hypothetical protein
MLTNALKRVGYKSANIREWLSFFAGMYTLSCVAFQHTAPCSAGIVALSTELPWLSWLAAMLPLNCA